MVAMLIAESMLIWWRYNLSSTDTMKCSFRKQRDVQKCTDASDNLNSACCALEENDINKELKESHTVFDRICVHEYATIICIHFELHLDGF